MSSNKNVSIIVLNWNNAPDTIECINSILKLSYDNFNLIICDNNSTDGSYDEILFHLEKINLNNRRFHCFNQFDSKGKAFSVINNRDVFLIQTGHNLGYAGGNNVGIRFALTLLNSEYIWILNNDTEVEPKSLQSFISYFDMHKNIDVLGSKVVYFNDRNMIQSMGGYYNKLLMTTRNAFYDYSVNYKFSDSEIQSLDYLVGASLCINRRVFDDVGLLEEKYFLYYEEIDFFNRIKNKFSFSVCLDSIVYHKVGASTKKGKSDIADFCSIRNRLLIAKKYHPYSYVFVWSSLVFILINRIRRKNYKQAFNVIRIFFGKRVF
ncbi:glycosyltransferase family 2 protein [uncultured Tolumonas sp.]|uniref:glycosyltransferase family 2 protein n=1 Tax=uncultured Tolumonas sp. TaxID=263765 RepID=UPI002931EFEE|nr:glycosyltransferase family 2 protein [uncultured Tolumonas sp.]